MDRSAPRDPMSKFETIYIHAGMSKTGTTSIQGAFRSNSKALLKQGFFYGTNSNHFQVSLAFSNPKSRLTTTSYFIAGLNRRQAIKRSKVYIDNNIAQATEASAPNLVFSSEFIFAAGANEIGEMVKHFQQYAKNVRLVIYVRDPMGRAVSQFQQQVKVGRRTLTHFDGMDKIVKCADHLMNIRGGPAFSTSLQPC